MPIGQTGLRAGLVRAPHGRRCHRQLGLSAPYGIMVWMPGGPRSHDGGRGQKRRRYAFENTACGFTRNNNAVEPSLSQCGGRSDGKGEFCSLSYSANVSFSMTSDQAKTAERGSDGSLPAIH
jgi:hypothetical protein